MGANFNITRFINGTRYFCREIIEEVGIGRRVDATDRPPSSDSRVGATRSPGFGRVRPVRTTPRPIATTPIPTLPIPTTTQETRMQCIEDKSYNIFEKMIMEFISKKNSTASQILIILAIVFGISVTLIIILKILCCFKKPIAVFFGRIQDKLTKLVRNNPNNNVYDFDEIRAT